MITEKAMALSEQARRREGGRGASARLANELKDEMIQNCQPTKKEFDELLEGVTYTIDMLWDFTLWIPKWAEMESKEQLPK